jgi:hypothetical protein
MSNAKKFSSILAAGALIGFPALAGSGDANPADNTTDTDAYTTSMPDNNSGVQQDTTVRDENDSIGGTGSTSDTLEGGSDTDTWTDTDTSTGTGPGMAPGTGSTGGASSSGNGSAIPAPNP